MLRSSISLVFLSTLSLWSNFQSVASFCMIPSKHSHATTLARLSHASPSGIHQRTVIRTNMKTDSETAKKRNIEPNVSIEYCTGCRWMFRSAWLSQELLTTFSDELGSVTLKPSKPPSPGGTFLVKMNGKILWDRKIEGSFPESKELKQKVRDIIAPKKDLGHSDVSPSNESSTLEGHCDECEEAEKQGKDISGGASSDENAGSNYDHGSKSVNIVYCTGCKWMMKAAYFAQELLTTFQEELNSVTLTPSRPPDEGGRFVSTCLYDITNLVAKFRKRNPSLHCGFLSLSSRKVNLSRWQTNMGSETRK